MGPRSLGPSWTRGLRPPGAGVLELLPRALCRPGGRRVLETLPEPAAWPSPGPCLKNNLAPAQDARPPPGLRRSPRVWGRLAASPSAPLPLDPGGFYQARSRPRLPPRCAAPGRRTRTANSHRRGTLGTLRAVCEGARRGPQRDGSVLPPFSSAANRSLQVACPPGGQARRRRVRRRAPGPRALPRTFRCFFFRRALYPSGCKVTQLTNHL